jgi:hypothetical protein
MLILPNFILSLQTYNYIINVTKPHPQPLSDGEGRKMGSNAPLSIGEGLGVRLKRTK